MTDRQALSVGTSWPICPYCGLADWGNRQVIESPKQGTAVCAACGKLYDYEAQTVTAWTTQKVSL